MESSRLWTMLLGMAFSLVVVSSTGVHPVIRKNIPECPPHAVCANIFHSTNGRDPRGILNCRCDTDKNDRVAGGCPYRDLYNGKSVFQSARNQEVLCQNVSSLPDCVSGEMARQLKSDYNGRRYFEVSCLCPYHSLRRLLVGRQKSTIPMIRGSSMYHCTPLTEEDYITLLDTK